MRLRRFEVSCPECGARLAWRGFRWRRAWARWRAEHEHFTGDSFVLWY